MQGTRQISSVTIEQRVILLRYSYVKLTLNQKQRLFNKNTGLCKFVKSSIEADACPVLVNLKKNCLLAFFLTPSKRQL